MGKGQARKRCRAVCSLARAQDENVGDGTTSVTILGGELLALAEPWLQRKMHPRVLIGGYTRALRDALDALNTIARPIDAKSDVEVLSVIRATLGTKFVSRWMEQMCAMSLAAVRIVATEENGRKEIDLKRFCHIEKIPGGTLTLALLLSFLSLLPSPFPPSQLPLSHARP